MPLTADVVRDFQTGITDVRAQGALDVAGAALVRRTVLKCVADSPIAIVLDLGGLTDMSDSGLAVLPMLERRLATDDPPVPLLGHAPVGAVIRAAGRFAVHLDRASALHSLAVGSDDPCRAHRALAPEPTSPAVARRFVAATCERWRLHHLSDEAQVIAGELVTNAVRHAGTDIGLTLSRGRAFLTITVGDRSRRAPTPRIPAPHAVKGRGLMLVGILADGWGTVLHADGKAVWAHLRIVPAGTALPN